MTLDPSTTRALTQRLAEDQALCRLPSIAAGVVRDGELVWADAIGAVDGRAGGTPATTDTQYRIGSISKTFVAVEILRLRDEGLLRLGDQLGTVLPEVSFPQVTIAQLLTHTSGLQAETNGEWWERTEGGTWEALLSSGVGLRSTPGTTFHYSNVGFAVLGEIIARLRGVPWSEAIRAGILERLDGYYKDEPLIAERDESGQVSRLVLASFVFTRTPYDPAADVPGGLDVAGWH